MNDQQPMTEEEQIRRELEEFKAEVDRTTTELTEKMHQLIGSSITEWSRMEGLLVHIASWLLDSRPAKVGLVFYSINNFHTWLSIIDELFVMDPNFSPLRSDWIKIADRLKKLNDMRVRMAHHALEPGRIHEILEKLTPEQITPEIIENDFAPSAVWPSLRPHKNDTRLKWKNKAISLEEMVAFSEQLTDVIETMGALINEIGPIYLGPKRRLVAKVKELQRKAAQHERTDT